MVSSVAIVYFALVCKLVWCKSLESQNHQPVKPQDISAEKVLMSPGSSAEAAENEYSVGNEMEPAEPYEVSVQSW